MIVDLGGNHQFIDAGPLDEGSEAALDGFRRSHYGIGQGMLDHLAFGGRPVAVQAGKLAAAADPACRAPQIDEPLLQEVNR